MPVVAAEPTPAPAPAPAEPTPAASLAPVPVVAAEPTPELEQRLEQRLEQKLEQRLEQRFAGARTFCMGCVAGAGLLFLLLLGAVGLLAGVHKAVPATRPTLERVAAPVFGCLPSPGLSYARSAFGRVAGSGFSGLPAPGMQVPSPCVGASCTRAQALPPWGEARAPPPAPAEPTPAASLAPVPVVAA